VRNRWKLVIALSALAIGSSPVAAQSGYLLAENLGYTGTVTCYATLSDALGGVGATCSAAIPQRDLSLYFVQNNPAFAGSGYPPSAAIFLTNWYAGGGSNPNNTNVGFMQMYDDGAGSVSSMSMGWNPTLTNFHLAASGGPTITGCTTIPPQDCGRLWNGGSQANGGSYHWWDVNVMFSGFSPATYNATTGVYESVSEPVSVSGTIRGVFADATTGMFHRLDATVNTTSWAASNGHAGTTHAGAVVPEPATILLVASGLVAVGAVTRRKRA
jgi:hypothetical protein